MLQWSSLAASSGEELSGVTTPQPLLQNNTGVGRIATICTVSSAVASQHPKCCTTSAVWCLANQVGGTYVMD